MPRRSSQQPSKIGEALRRIQICAFLLLLTAIAGLIAAQDSDEGAAESVNIYQLPSDRAQALILDNPRLVHWACHREIKLCLTEESWTSTKKCFGAEDLCATQRDAVPCFREGKQLGMLGRAKLCKHAIVTEVRWDPETCSPVAHREVKGEKCRDLQSSEDSVFVELCLASTGGQGINDVVAGGGTSRRYHLCLAR